jgi:hypothetical protein
MLMEKVRDQNEALGRLFERILDESRRVERVVLEEQTQKSRKSASRWLSWAVGNSKSPLTNNK